MSKFFYCFLLIWVVFANPLWAQHDHGVCGMSASDQEYLAHRIEANRAAVASGAIVTDRSDVQYVPIHFHIVGNNSGSGRLRERRVLDQLCRLNEEYAPVDIQFYLSPHPVHGWFNKSISNDNVYDDQSNTGLMESNRHPNAINIWVVNNAASNSNSTGTVLGYYRPSSDWVVIRKDEITGSPSKGTTGHEVGHFFSLMHTFRGWENEPFTDESPTWPTAPASSPGGQPTERVSGSNCTTAGDRICDTPADYNFGFGWNGCTAYTAGALDPDGTPVDPQENNFMGYFIGCSNGYVFSQGQSQAMNTDLASSDRNYLDNNFTPPALSINTPDDLLVAPDNGITVPFFDEVTLQWNAVPGANLYFVEVDVVPVFSSSLNQSFMLENTTSLTLTNLMENRLYHWRVTPMNPYYVCADSKVRNFRTSQTSGVTSPTEVAGWQVSPNPVKKGDNLRITLQSNDSFDGAITLFDLTGKPAAQMQHIRVQPGGNIFEIATGHMPTGIYMLTLDTPAGRTTKRVICTD